MTEMPTKPGYDRSHAIVVGIDHYASASPLGYAVSDAKAVAGVLPKMGFDPSDIHVLLDQAATGKAIHRSFLQLSRDATSIEDRLFIFYAGHGHTERARKGDVGYLVPYDGDYTDLSSLLRWDLLTRDADLISAKHILFVMDACYGGLAITRSLKPGSSRFLKDMMQRTARQVLTAGKADEVVADLGGPRPDHSVFTGHFLDALEGAAASDGILTANGVMAYVYDKVSLDGESEQTPHFGYLSGDGDFIFNPPELTEEEEDLSKDQDKLIPIPGSVLLHDSGASLIDRAKGLIASASSKIHLYDLVSQETRHAIAATSQELFAVQGSWSPEEFARRIQDYNQATKDLRSLQMLLGFWGSEVHYDSIVLPGKRLAEQVTNSSGLNVWLRLRWYPVLVLVYSCGLGAVYADKYANFFQLLHARIPDPRQYKSTTTVVEALCSDVAELIGAFKTLPGHERQHVPTSEYLFKELQPTADDLLFVGAEYEEVFDRVEMLIALECWSLEGWGPPGRFSWKHSSRGRVSSPYNAIIEEAKMAGPGWKPLKAGFFSGSADVFQKTAEAYSKFMEGLRFW
jgi:hypothetical protein